MVGSHERHIRVDKRVSRQPSLPLVGGLVWRNEWKEPYEGGLTLLWKIALANCLTPRELCSRMFGTNLLSGTPCGLHGRTLLAPHWMSNASNSQTELGRIVRHSGVDTSSARWVEVIAGDEHIRYCKACMAEGYQSAYCQIDGLLTCPVHGLPLLESCTTCGAATPRYALTSLTMSMPFCCSSCGEPLAERPWNPFKQKQPVPIVRKLATYRSLGKWLSSVERLELFWPHLPSWQCGNEGLQGNVERRIAVFDILRQLVPLSLKRECLREPIADFSISANLSTEPKAFVPLRHALPTEKWAARRHAYTAIRRHIRRILVRNHHSCLKASRNTLHIEWDNEVLHPHESVCPVVFAYYLWRHHFEHNLAIYPQVGATNHELSMREEVLAWPADREVGTKAWATFVMMSFISYIQVANEWCARAEQVADARGVIDFVSMMRLISDFRVALSPKYMAWPSRVTFLCETLSSPGNQGRIAIVGPSGQLDGLLSKRHVATA